MNRGCVLGGAVVQYGLTCCSSACHLCDVGTFNATTADDTVYEFWTTERVQEYVKEGQCLDDPEGKFTGVQVSKHDYAKMLQVINGWWLTNANHQSQTTNWVFTTVLGRNQSRRDEMTTTVTREDDSEVTVTQLIDVLGLRVHCEKVHDSGSDGVHTVNCIAPLLRHVLSLYLDLKAQFYHLVEVGYNRMEQVKILHDLTTSDDIVGATIDLMSHCNMVDESTELLEQLGMVYPSGDMNHDEAVQELSARIQEGGSERSRLAERIGDMFKASGGGPPSDHDSSDATTVSSCDTNQYDRNDCERNTDDGSLEFADETGGDGDDSGDDDENRFSSRNERDIDPSKRLAEETRLLRRGECTDYTTDGSLGLDGYAPVAVHQREVKLVTQSELRSWQ